MMTLTFALLALSSVEGLAVLAQDDPDAAIRAIAEKISKEGISGRLAEAAASDAGLQAIREKIDFLLAARISRFERDSVGHLEDYLFTVDAAGDLHLRPERRPEIDALVRRLPLASRAMSGFSRRADDLVRRLGSGEMDARAKAAWSDPGFRTAFFHRHPAELRELDDAELLAAVGFRGLQKGRIAGPWAQELRQRIAMTAEQLEVLKLHEKSYLKLVTGVSDGTARAQLAKDTSILFLIGRVIRQVHEGAPAPIGALVEANEENKVGAAITFTKDLAEFLPEVKEFERTLAELQKDLDRIAGEAEPGDFVEFLRNPRARALLAERILDLQEEQRRRADEIMNATLEDGFTADGDKLTVKKGRYVDGEGKDSPDTLAAELDGIIAEFNGSLRQDFDRIAERCLDPGVIAIFEDRPGTYLLAEFRDRVIETLAHEIRAGGLDLFVKTYLTKQGDTYGVRPERASRVEAILKRAADISAGK